MVAMEEFRLQVVSPFYHRPGPLRPVSGYFSGKGDIRAGRCYHCSRGDAVNRELGHDSPVDAKAPGGRCPRGLFLLATQVVRYPRRPDTGTSMSTAVLCPFFRWLVLVTDLGVQPHREG